MGSNRNPLPPRPLFAWETTGLRKWKYRLTMDYEADIPLTGHNVKVQHNGGEWAHLQPYGHLTIRTWYHWDGPSGPALDTPTFMRASLVHDVLYQFIREGLLPDELRSDADGIMREIALADGMSRFRARYAWLAVRAAGGRYARKGGPRG